MYIFAKEGKPKITEQLRSEKFCNKSATKSLSIIT